jgi:shikimate dehydrogenase
MTDRYAVIGNPVAHSRSPEIHAAFACALGEDIEYGKLLATIAGFRPLVERFRNDGGKGLNITLPFKEEAFRYADALSDRARAAEAVNTLRFDAGRVFGDNTDGVGLIRDITRNLGVSLAGKRMLLLGAGGAARGVLGPLLAEHPARFVIANRAQAKAQALVSHFGAGSSSTGYAALAGCRFDVVINATSASLADQLPPIPPGIFAQNGLAYDMAYGRVDTPFLERARSEGVGRVADGSGMLIEQAAESYFVWRGVRPPVEAGFSALRRLQER